MTRYVISLTLTALVAGCAGWKSDARTALDVASTACALAQPFRSTTEEVAAACGIADALTPVLHDLLAAKKQARRAGYVHNADEGCP
jgi:Cdc6-like AAA superfamily ATPase